VTVVKLVGDGLDSLEVERIEELLGMPVVLVIDDSLAEATKDED
jgi:hypothetical protein